LEKIFPSKDFSSFGSKSFTVRPAHEKRKLLPKYLDKLLERPQVFDPRTVKLSDRGSIARVEINTLSTGKRKLVGWLEEAIFRTG